MVVAEERERRWPEPTPDELLKVLRAAGWLLEQEAALALERADFEVTQSWAFEDVDDPTKSREIDVAAFREVFRDDAMGLTVTVNVLIECKDSTMPWALVGRTKPPAPIPIERKDVQYVFDRIEYDEHPSSQGMQHKYVGATQYLGLHTLTANPWARGFEATVLTRLNKKKDTSNWETANASLMWEVMFPMAKAMTTLGSEVETFNAGTRGVNNPALNTQTTRGRVALYFPLVVTSAPLYRVDYTSGMPEVSTAPWVPLRRRIDNRTLKGEFHAVVVNAEALQDFITNQIGGFATAVADLARDDPTRFLRQIDRAWTPPS